MKRYLYLCALLGLANWSVADIIALKNGQTLEIPGSFEVKGAYVVYTNEDGDLLQLPLKMVDVERSHQLTAEREAAIAAADASKAAEKEKPEVVKTIADVANAIEVSRDEDNPVRSDLTIDSASMSEYVRENPLADNSVQTGGGISVRSASDMAADAQAFGESYKQSLKESEEIENELQTARSALTALEQESAFGDNSSVLYESQEKLRAKIAELEQKKSDKDSEVSRLQKEAKAAGVRDLERKNRPRTQATSNNDDDLTIRSQKIDDYTIDPEDDDN